jgi:glycerol dehydrogenase
MVRMFKKAAFPGKYVQGEGALRVLPAMLAAFGGGGMILASSSVIGKVLPGSGLVPSEHGILVEPFQGECCEEELTRLAGVINNERVDVLVGMGGGKTIDAAKIAADRANIPSSPP